MSRSRPSQMKLCGQTCSNATCSLREWEVPCDTLTTGMVSPLMLQHLYIQNSNCRYLEKKNMGHSIKKLCLFFFSPTLIPHQFCQDSFLHCFWSNKSQLHTNYRETKHITLVIHTSLPFMLNRACFLITTF